MEQQIINIKNFNWALGLNRLGLQAIGLWSRKNEIQSYSTGYKDLLIPIMVITTLLTLILPETYALTMVFRNLPLVVNNLALYFPIVNATSNIFILWIYRQELKPVISTLISDWMSSNASWKRNIMLKQAGRARIFTIICYSMMFGDYIGFTITSIFGFSFRIINNITDPDENRYLPIQAYYPYDFTKSPQFELTYAFQLISSGICVIGTTVLNNFFGALIFHACGQCEILEYKMRTFVPGNYSIDFGTMEKENRIFRFKIQEVVKNHIHIIRFISSVEKSFNLLILVQVLFMSLTICCLGFGVISFKNSYETLPVIQIVTLVGTVINLMIHMLVYCSACELLATHSSGICDALYYSNWYLLSAKYSKDFIPIMTRSKYPLQLTAGKFVKLSLNCYLRILKTSFAYFSLLLAVSG